MATVSERIKALASWGWKREGLPAWALFDKPYQYPANGDKKITIHQSKATLGSTVWDSSIVLSKFFEKMATSSEEQFKQYKSAIELGAGCGLVGVVLSHLGVEDVVLTDMGDTMEILRKNAREHAPATGSLTAVELEWGKPSAIDGKKFDLIVATDTMYTPEAIPALILCLLTLVHENTAIYFAYGRNSYAEADFYRHLKTVNYMAERISNDELDPIFQSPEIKVIKIRRRKQGEESLPSYEGDPVEVISADADSTDAMEEVPTETAVSKRSARRRGKKSIEQDKQTTSSVDAATTKSSAPATSDQQDDKMEEDSSQTASRAKRRRERRKMLKVKQEPTEDSTTNNAGKDSAGSANGIKAESAGAKQAEKQADKKAVGTDIGKAASPAAQSRSGNRNRNAAAAASPVASKGSGSSQPSLAAKLNANKVKVEKPDASASPAKAQAAKAPAAEAASPAQGKGKRKRGAAAGNAQLSTAKQQGASPNDKVPKPVTKRQKTNEADNDDMPLEQSSAPPKKQSIPSPAPQAALPKAPQKLLFEQPAAEATPSTPSTKKIEEKQEVSASPAAGGNKRKRPQTPTQRKQDGVQSPSAKKNQQQTPKPQQPSAEQTTPKRQKTQTNGAAKPAALPSTPSDQKDNKQKSATKPRQTAGKAGSSPPPKAQNKAGGQQSPAGKQQKTKQAAQTPTTPSTPKTKGAPAAKSTPGKDGPAKPSAAAGTTPTQNKGKSPAKSNPATRGKRRASAPTHGQVPKKKPGSSQRRREKMKLEKENQEKEERTKAAERRVREDKGELIESEVIAPPKIVF